MESKRDRELGALHKMFFLRGKKSIRSSVPSAPLQQLPSGAAGRKPEVIVPRVLVGLHLGTTYSCFSYAHEFKLSPIFTCYQWPKLESRRDGTPTAMYYKPEVGKANGDLRLSSWGYMAWTEFEKDLAAMRDLREQAATDVNVQSSGDMPVVGSYVTPLRHHLSGRDAGPSSASDLPPGLTLNRVISDYLRAMGNFILRHLQVQVRSDLSMQDVQWCVTVPSIWSHNPRQQMKSCMVDAGLVVGGSNGMNASTHPVIMVLKTDAASYWSCEELCLQRGDKVLLANIGYDPTDVVLQEWVGCEVAYNFKVFKDLMHSSSGLGRIHVEKQYIEFLCQKVGPLREYLLRFPELNSRLLEEWERETERFNKFIDLPVELALEWEEHNKRLGLLHPWNYYRIRLSKKDMENIIDPIVEATLDFIAAQLSQTTGIRAMVVIAHFAGLSDLKTRIRHRFGDRVGEIVVKEASELTMSRAAVGIAQDCFPGHHTITFDLVVEVIDNMLIQTRQMDNHNWANNNCVSINWGQCNHLANKLAEMKDWLLQEHQNSEIILTLDMHRDLLSVVKSADLLVWECCKSKDWGKAALLQAGNEEAFVGILHDLKWWCTHFLNHNILSGLNSSEQLQSLGDADNLNQFEQDHILARRAALDREELMSREAMRIAKDCFPGPGTKTFDLVVEVIENVLIQPRQMDNQDWANNNCVRINQGQCNHLANKLAEMKDWLLQEHQNPEIVLAWAMHRVLLHLLRVLKMADLLVWECCKSKDWGKAAVLQAGNEEAFVGILHDLKWWCTHFLNLTILSGFNSSEQIQSLGYVDKLNQFEQDRILARRAALDRKELVANLMQFKRHDKSDVMVDHLVDRYSQQASDQSTTVDFPLFFWNTQELPIVKHLGHGAYGVVYESVWLGLPCAQKVFMGAENVSFKKEADILAALKHPNIIKLFCCTTNAKSCSLVMELMSTDLRNLMDEKMKDPQHVVPFSLPVAVDIMLQVARGLKYMHEQQVGHRDIKSSNILVNLTSVPELAEMGYIDVKVADFGLAKAKLMSSTATKQTNNIGTKSYMAPELYTQEEEEIAKKNYPLKADVYSYGTTCAEILTGNIPFPHTEYKRSKLLQVIRQGERPPLPLDCPTLLANLITRCWDTDPCKRPGFLQVCNELLDFKRSNMMI